MASKRNPSEPAGPQRQSRRSQTIELGATEVSRETAAPSSESPSGTTPPRNVAWLPPGNAGVLVAAFAVGAAGALLAVGLLSLGGYLGGGSTALENRLSGIEAQIRELSMRPTADRPDNRPIEALASRIERLEKGAVTASSPLSDPALANRLASAESATKAFADDIGSLNRRVDDLAATVRELRNRAETTETAMAEIQKALRTLAPGFDKNEIEAMANRIAALERAAGTMETELGRRATVTSDRAVRLALATSALRAAVERGEPFATELAAARPLTDDNAFAALEPFVATGVPSTAALAQELSTLIPALRNALGAQPVEGGFFERLKANASRLIRIRPVDDPGGDEPAALIIRIETKAASADLAGALADLAKLPEPVRAPAKPWIEKVQARNAAVQTSRQLAADAIRALGKVTH
ncbi:MAG TPA: hypothetical protein VNK48_03380 [Xanthobacteraceae bacterium]|nr:hypothetical protein [Xanthobacteraceae bacterium]